MTVRLTVEAERDLAEIARYTATAFGVAQAMHYAALIEHDMDLLAENPLRPASRARDELRPGVRSMHLSRAAARRHAAAHVLYYHLAAGTDEAQDIVILRVLHERMEPLKRLVDANSPEKDSSP
ncbi:MULTISPECIES: type II toxin-antitoxin system RelE/ParE family toxin [unclassified Shinella]|uniref:type II toxin-antitoxin system RelE/ParE family toxin n=1 Tax=unclassified Shinella TaxID=2643062 RepID=UPI00225C8F4A|nr:MULTISPECIES: type II toxin-antitoxin system RelE/ParE family toxin [unclassified Shinella]MCO5136130.1 type II toxin-antitoxin system RelE/ParE family toxin [Shinella sp.]MDC7254233.1 type II toxin-antitoxin system RelE/ParE family toxin [Shinella sp. YE25]CAI0336911.1 Toxin ParE1/3/4 [Rhizobiaceae bacterium]CAK7255438.1 toxin ParE1/3/4 [Shinella sp. WSC3-e]